MTQGKDNFLQHFKISKCFSSGDLWKCRFCDNPFEPEYIATYVQSLEDELYAISKSDPTPQKLEAFLKGHFKDLHPKHYLNLIGKILIILNCIGYNPSLPINSLIQF